MRLAVTMKERYNNDKIDCELFICGKLTMCMRARHKFSFFWLFYCIWKTSWRRNAEKASAYHSLPREATKRKFKMKNASFVALCETSKKTMLLNQQYHEPRTKNPLKCFFILYAKRFFQFCLCDDEFCFVSRFRLAFHNFAMLGKYEHAKWMQNYHFMNCHNNITIRK